LNGVDWPHPETKIRWFSWATGKAEGHSGKHNLLLVYLKVVINEYIKIQLREEQQSNLGKISQL